MNTQTQSQDIENVRNDKIKRTYILGRIAAFAFFSLTFLIYGSALAVAPKLCIPNATGVAFQSGPPNWWDTSSGSPPVDTIYNKELMITTDPRWRGALSVDYSKGGPTNAEFRGVYKAATKELLLSWAVKGMNFTSAFTSLVVGIKSQNGTIPVVLRLSVNGSDTSKAAGSVQPKSSVDTFIDNNNVATSYIGFQNYIYNSSLSKWEEFAGAGSNNSWASDSARVWIKPTSTANNAAWLIQMRVPLVSLPGFDQSNTSVHLWYSMQSSVPIGAPGSALIRYTWPTETASEYTYYVTYFSSQPVHHIPDLANWGEVGFGQQQSGCAGIKLADSDIGVVNAEFPGRSRISLGQKNIFYALPQNMSGAQMDMSNLTATFYFANWGSQLGTLVANQSWQPEPTLMTDLTQPSPNINWNVSSAPPNPPVAAGQTLGTSVAANSGIPTPAAVPDTLKAQLWRDWTLAQKEQCRFFDPSDPTKFLANKEKNNVNYCAGIDTAPFAPHSVHPHGCMLVKLNGPGKVFLNDSAFRNMNFGAASVFQQDASISIAGLPKSKSGIRDVYLFVDKRNMPSYRPVLKFGKLNAPEVVISPEVREINAMLRDPKSIKAISTPLAHRLLRSDSMLARSILEKNPKFANKMQMIVNLPDRKNEIISSVFDTLAAALPTYAINTFNDSDATVYIAGRPHKLLTQQTSFGVYLLHDTKYYGWTEDMLSNALEVAPGVKKLSIQDGRTVVIRPRLEAIEKFKQVKYGPMGTVFPDIVFKPVNPQVIDIPGNVIKPTKPLTPVLPGGVVNP